MFLDILYMYQAQASSSISSQQSPDLFIISLTVLSQTNPGAVLESQLPPQNNNNNNNNKIPLVPCLTWHWSTCIRLKHSQLSVIYFVCLCPCSTTTKIQVIRSDTLKSKLLVQNPQNARFSTILNRSKTSTLHYQNVIYEPHPGIKHWPFCQSASLLLHILYLVILMVWS